MAIETQALIVYVISLALVFLMKIVCFILGYLTIRLGYQLINSGVKGDFKFAANLAGFKADLASVSPGLLFVFLGVVLIGYAMQVDKNVNVTLPPGTTVAKTDSSPPQVPIPPAMTAGESTPEKPKPTTTNEGKGSQ